VLQQPFGLFSGFNLLLMTLGLLGHLLFHFRAVLIILIDILDQREFGFLTFLFHFLHFTDALLDELLEFDNTLVEPVFLLAQFFLCLLPITDFLLKFLCAQFQQAIDIVMTGIEFLLEFLQGVLGFLVPADFGREFLRALADEFFQILTFLR